MHEDPDEESYHLYTCTLRPTLWYLTQRHDSRVFVDKTVLEITQTLLEELGASYQNKCQNSYRKYGHSIQYQETSFNYLNRLFEQEGIYYYFEHHDGAHNLIIVDNKSSHDTILGKSILPYHSIHNAAGTPEQAYIDTWVQSDHLVTKSVNINDHNYNTAKSRLSATSTTHELNSTVTEDYQFYTNFKTAEEANHYKQMRAEDYKARSKRTQATGNALTIAPGYKFSLSRHPHDAANVEHLIVSAQYHLREAGYTSGSEASLYRIEFTALPTSYQFRAPLMTPKPKMIGTQAAIITGPAGEEVYTNDYGDVKLQFHWDRYGPMNERSSDWVRVTQGSAGVNFGSINTPRIDEEVLVDFINGDSDRPIIVGRLFNSANPPPWGYPVAAKQSGIKSKSFNSPIENFNELMFDDTASSERVNFQAQKDLDSLIKNDETRHVGHDRTTTIDNDETVTVHGHRTETVDKNETITIHQNRTEVVDLDETITIHKNRQERVDDDETISIGGSRHETVSGNEYVTVKGNQDLTVEKNQTESINKNRSLKVKKNNKEHVSRNKSVTVNMAFTTQVGAVMNTAVGLLQAEEVGGMKKTMVGKSYSISVGDKFEISVGSSTLTMTPDSISITGKSILLGAEKTNTIIGNNVEINPGAASAESGSGGSAPPAGTGGDATKAQGFGGEGEDYESNIVVTDQDGNVIPEDQRPNLIAGGIGSGGQMRHGQVGDNTIQRQFMSGVVDVTKTRKSTEGEKELLERVYGKGTIDYEKLKIHNAKMMNDRSAVIDGEIYFDDDYYVDDFSASQNPLAANYDPKRGALFIHENVHVWQAQQGHLNVANAAYLQGAYELYDKTDGKLGFDPYEYDIDPNKDFGDYNMEQQGEIIADYYVMTNDYPDKNYTGLSDTAKEILDEKQNLSEVKIIYEKVLSEFKKDPNNVENLPNWR